jgi:hypothetical protein
VTSADTVVARAHGVVAAACQRVNRHARALSTLTAAVLASAIAIGLHWSFVWGVLTVVLLSASTLAAQSVGRAVISGLAAIGVVATVIWLLVAVSPGTTGSLHVTWTVVVIAFGLLMFVFACTWRAIDARPSYSLAEVLAAWIGIAFAVRLYVQMDYQSSLLRLLVHVEDNAAWVSLTRDVASGTTVGPGIHGALGPVIPTLLGLLHGLQAPGVPTYNATFSAYALAVFILPVVVAALLVGRLRLPMLGIAGFTLVLIAWAYRVPFLLFASFGHLSAIWAVVLLVGLSVFFLRASQSRATLAIGLGLALAVGGIWFPIAPLGIAAIWVVLAMTWSGMGTALRVAAGVVALISTYALASQIPVAEGGDPTVPQESFSSLYAAQGGTATLDATLLLVALVGVALLGWLSANRGGELSRASTLTICGVLYVAAVYGGAYFLRVGIGYGPTKVAYVIGSVLIVVLIAAMPRIELPARVAVSILAVLAFGSLIYGGGSDIASRSWPGDPPPPPWLEPLERVVDQVGESSVAPIGCVSSSKWSSYLCTRWGAALTSGGDGTFLAYRLAVANDLDVGPAVDDLASRGLLAKSDVIVVDEPRNSDAPAWVLIADAGRVFGPNGSELTPRPTRPPTGS